MQNPAPIPSRSTTNLSDPPRYWFFISYSHSDIREASRIQRAIETFRIPSALRQSSTRFRSLPKKPASVFRDRDALASTHDLTAEIRAALASSASLLVVCSPASSQSKWVAREVESFLEIHGPESVLCLVVDGEPNSADPALECLPEPLRRSVFGRDILAADLRREADGRRQALLKILAGGLGLSYELLAARERKRATRRAIAWSAASLAIAICFAALALQADHHRRQALVEARRANLTADYLTSLLLQFLPRQSSGIPNAALIPLIESSAAPERLAPLAEEPKALIRIRNILATAFYQLDRSDKALELYKQNLELADSVLGPDSPVSMECRFNVANASAGLGNNALAEKLYRELLVSTGKNLAEFRDERITVVNNLASGIGHQGRKKEAAELFEKYFNELDHYKPSELPVLHYRANYANQLLTLGESEKSAAIFRDVVDIHMKARGPDHGDTLLAKHQLANALGTTENFTETEALYREILPSLEKKFGRNHSLTLGTAFKLVCLLHDLNRPEEGCAISTAFFGNPPDPELVKNGSGPGERLPPCP